MEIASCRSALVAVGDDSHSSKAARAQRLADEFERDFHAERSEAGQPDAGEKASVQTPSFKVQEAMDGLRPREAHTRTELESAALDNDVRPRRSMASEITEMPWEKRPYTMLMGCTSKMQLHSEAPLRMAADSNPPLWLSLPITEDYVKLQLAGMKRAENHLGLYRAAVLRTRDATLKPRQGGTMRNLLSKSMILLEDHLHASKVGSQMVAVFRELGYYDAQATNMILDMYGGEVPRTINKRTGALQRYVIWAREYSSGRSALPVEEPVAHDYLCYPHKEVASTAPASFMGAANFGFYVLGIEGCDLASASARAKGVAHMQSVAKKPAAQSHPLTIQQAHVLEEMVARAPNAQDRNPAEFGTSLYTSRASFSEAIRDKAILEDMQVDPRTLGYHIASDGTSCFTYGKDNQSEPLRWVERVLETIRSVKFRPDQTRSGRFKEGADPLDRVKELFTTRARIKPAEIDALEPVMSVVGEVDKRGQDSASSSSSHDRATSEESDNTLQNKASAPNVGMPIEYDYTRLTSRRLYKHTESGILHWASFTNFAKLACGRLWSNRLAKISQALRVKWSFCNQCARGYRPRRSSQPQAE
jgi:hypothetical protein